MDKRLTYFVYSAVDDLLESSSSSSDDEELALVLHPTNKYLRVMDFVQGVVNLYANVEFKKHFRVERDSAEYLISKYPISRYYAKRSYKEGRPQLAPNTHVLLFLWFCSNKTTIREVSNLFNISYSFAHYMINNVTSFLVELSRNVIKFPQSEYEKEGIAKNFEAISGFPNVLGCIDGTYISIRAPKLKIRSTYINRHSFIHSLIY
ncbi:putative nuclease HARBI1 [Eurosta solidaginis]|uniref:putative nuclease HARBI1 n=1 Tax=Eurosta solidaginis TaxID=178769 RepID=UPI0035317AA7